MRSKFATVILLGILLCSCKPYVLSNSAVEQFPQADQEIDFLGAVEKMQAVTNNDAIHGFLLLADGTDPFTDYPQRLSEAKKRQWVQSDFGKPANEAAKVGWMATAGCRVMHVQGGLTMRLFGPMPRYATKELVFMEILPLRTENQILTGGEFVDYLNRLDRIAGKNRRAQSGTPLGMPAGESAAMPGNEAAIQEGTLPEQGPREGGSQPAPESGGQGASQPSVPGSTPSTVPGTLTPPPRTVPPAS